MNFRVRTRRSILNEFHENVKTINNLIYLEIGSLREILVFQYVSYYILVQNDIT